MQPDIIKEHFINITDTAGGYSIHVSYGLVGMVYLTLFFIAFFIMFWLLVKIGLIKKMATKKV